MRSWIQISADVGLMSAAMIRYVEYRLATRDNYYYVSCVPDGFLPRGKKSVYITPMFPFVILAMLLRSTYFD